LTAICLSGSSSARAPTWRRWPRHLERLREREHLGLGTEQRDATTGHHALLDRSLGGLHRVLDAVLLLLELHLGGCTDLDDGHAAGQLREALLELLAVVVRVGVVDLGADLVDPAGDVRARARASTIVSRPW